MKKYVTIYSLVSWIVLMIQFILIIQNRVVSIPETIVRFFSFFTILTNILVAITFTVIWLQPKNGMAFFLKANTQTAIAVYILIVGIVYNVILRFIWQPQGLQRIVDEFLHLIIPIVYVLFWYLEVDKQTLKWNTIFGWLIYPLVYVFIILLLGSFSNYYPYPFIDVAKLGYYSVVINSVLLTLFFGLVSVIFVFVAKRRSK